MKKAPHAYARLLDAAYGSLKRRSRRNLVIGGNSFTTGDVSPRNWIRNPAFAEWKAAAHGYVRPQPFSARRPLPTGAGHGFADFSDLDLLARWVDRYLGRPRRKRRMKLFSRSSSGPRTTATMSSTSGSPAAPPPAG